MPDLNGELLQLTVKYVKTKMRSTMKICLLNGFLHILVNDQTSHMNEAKLSCEKVLFIFTT